MAAAFFSEPFPSVPPVRHLHSPEVSSGTDGSGFLEFVPQVVLNSSKIQVLAMYSGAFLESEGSFQK